MTDTIIVDGDHTNARIHADKSLVEDDLLEQVQSMVDHEAFDQDIEIMPDTHPGAGSVIGFTMPIGEKLVPNCVGVDIGCGLTAYNLGDRERVADEIEENPEDVDEGIRKRIPLGYDTFGDVEADQDYHIVDDFPWARCTRKVQSLNENITTDVSVDDEFGKEYFLDLCKRVGYDTTRAINSIGTLGGGNHFVEIGQSEETGEYWVIVHSGSRGIGLSIAEYWQGRAHRHCDSRADYVWDALLSVPDWTYTFDVDEVSDAELLDWVQGGMGEDWKRTDEIRERLDGEEIGELVDQLNAIARHVAETDSGHELDYLAPEDRAGYLKDMAFAQTYAEESRHEMCQTVVRDVLGVSAIDIINSTHNYIDYEDCVIRKGATRAQDGELAVIPFDMSNGAVLVEGLGNDDWNRSAPHGAGRRGSRRWAHETFDVGEFEAEMDDVYSSSVGEATLDEAPMAYKDHESILDAIEETADVVDVLEPRINIKAED